MRASIFFGTLLLTLTAAQSTVTVQPVTQIADGQVQAPQALNGTTTTAAYTNPFTSYTTQTDSLGVITGMPSVVTSQPAVITSQPAVVTSQPSVAGVIMTTSYANTTMATSARSSMSSVLMSASSSASSVRASAGSATSSASIEVSTGGAVNNRITGTGLGLVVLGGTFALL